MRITLGLNLLGAIWLAASAGLTTAAQLTTTQPLSAPAATQPASEQLTLNFPENVELRVLVEYVSQRLGINIFYDQQTVTQQVTIRAPASIPKDSLLELLASVLQSKGLALVDAEQPGWKRIVPATALLSVARPTTAPTTGPVSRIDPVTLVLRLDHADPQKAEQLIKPFLTQPGGNSIALTEQRLLIITDFGANTARLRQLVELVDRPEAPVLTKFISLKHLDAQAAATQLSTFLQARQRARGAAAAATAAEVIAEPRTNQLAIIGSQSDIAAAEEVARSIDVELALETRLYPLQFASPERLDALIKELIGGGRSDYQSSIDRQGNQLAVRASESLHQTIEELAEQLDRRTESPAAAPIRFYRLENTTASEALSTIEAIAGETEPPDGSDTARRRTGSVGDERIVPAERAIPPGSGAGSIIPPLPSSVWGRVDTPEARQAAGGTEQARSVRTRNAVVTADPNTNSLIVVAPPEAQQFFAHLIEMLDKRRAQVLIECTVVTLDTSNDFSLGVEISLRGSSGDTDTITFSSFGLSRVGSTAADLGRLLLIPGIGFNGTVISSDVADIVVKALATSGRAEVVSAPRILVNDNATGSLASVQEAPFTSVNASDTIATTSFGGYASAGTSINLTPHISEGDFLQLEYTIALNSFTGAGDSQAGTPPPRQTNQLQSRVTIPDGSTIIVGGLTRRDRSRTKDSIPLLGDVPLLEYLFSSRNTRETSSTLFVFIRPVILRDDQFADLKHFSRHDQLAAGIAPDLPATEPMVMR